MRSRVWLIGWATLVLFGIGGLLVIYLFQERSFSDVWQKGINPLLQVLIGIIAGLISAISALRLINQAFFKEQKAYYYKLLSSKIPLNYRLIVFLSLCAGIGEELFFRAGLQPLIGLWITSIIFVALHGYFSFSSKAINLYGLLMLIIIASFGYMYRYLGLISVMCAHTVFDIVLFSAIYRETKSEISQPVSIE